MPTLYTIGWERRSLADFVQALQSAAIDAVIDVRLHNTSQLAGYTKRDDLGFLLRFGFGISYEHHPELAPTPEIFDAYRQAGDWEVYRTAFIELLVERRAAAMGTSIMTRYPSPCLMCYEKLPDRCHRSLIAELWSTAIPDLSVVHL